MNTAPSGAGIVATRDIGPGGGTMPPAIAVNVAGEPVRPGTVAVALCSPLAGPSVNVASAMPSWSVTLVGVTVPPPAMTSQVTTTPATGSPSASRIRTWSGLASG